MHAAARKRAQLANAVLFRAQSVCAMQLFDTIESRLCLCVCIVQSSSVNARVLQLFKGVDSVVNEQNAKRKGA